MTFFDGLFAFVLLLGVLITVHEFGHFLVAKACGVRVLKFSVGFGPPIGFGRFRLAWHRNGTDYVIAWLPLGGFVKMLGEHTSEIEGVATEDELVLAQAHPSETLSAKPTWQKLAIILAGPVMNLVLPVVVFAGILAYGMERPAPVIGTVELGSPARQAGLVPGDHILAVDGEPVEWWSDVEDAIRSQPGELLSFTVERSGEPFEVRLPIENRDGLDAFRLRSEVGWVGIRHERLQPRVGVVGSDSPAAAAGLHSGDLVLSVDGTPVEDWGAFERAYAAAEGEALLRVERQAADPEAGTEPVDPEAGTEERELRVPVLSKVTDLGLVPATVLVSRVSEDSAAEAAGLREGDLIFAVDGRPVGSFASFSELVAASGGRPLEIAFARGGATHVKTISPRLTRQTGGPVEEERYLIGVEGRNGTIRGAAGLDQEWNPLVSVPRAAGMTLEITGLFLQGLQKLVTGEISRRHLGGPIEIARQSHLAMQAGWDTYLRLLVLISINLGILNLLPIPVLDGGQALLFTVEGVKRSPLSMRTRELVQQVGLAVLLFLMGFAFWNDISRHWSKVVAWVRESAGL